MKKNKFKLDFRRKGFHWDLVLVVKFIVLIILVGWAMMIYQNLKRFEYFRVKEVTIRQGSNIIHDEKNFVYLIGRNIFELDLAKEVRNAVYYYPSYQRIRMTRFFPSHLVVDFLQREPLACIKSSRTFYIDENLILFELPNETVNENLPVICGIDKYILNAKYGSKCRFSAVEAALNIIKQAKQNKVFRDYRIKKIDLSGFDNALIFLLVPGPNTISCKTNFVVPEQIIKVKIGWGDIHSKLVFLATLLAQIKNNTYNIEYIDLRFKESVIKFKERI